MIRLRWNNHYHNKACQGPFIIIHHNNIVSLIGSLTRLEEPDYLEMWLKCFGAYPRRKNSLDKRNVGGENERLVTDLFLA